MAYLRTNPSEFHAGPGLLTRMGAALLRGFDDWMQACSRADRVQALEAKSDAELAAMGLQRDDIVKHVFRDKMDF